MGHPRQIIDAGLIGTCIAFLITFLNMQPKAFDAHLNNAVIAFRIALPLLGWGYLQAALKPKPVPGWLVLQAILLGSWAAEGIGELAAFIGLLFVLWHFSFSAFLAAHLASGFVLIVVSILSFIGLFIYALVNAEELAKKQQATGPAASVQDGHVGTTPPRMKKRRIGQDAPTQRSVSQLCREPVPRLIGMCAGTTQCCADEQDMAVSST